jgi:hypothetical protein
MKKTIRRAIHREQALEATCLYRDEQTRRWIRCGWYGGSHYDQVGGTTVTCTYNERRTL